MLVLLRLLKCCGHGFCLLFVEARTLEGGDELMSVEGDGHGGMLRWDGLQQLGQCRDDGGLCQQQAGHPLDEVDFHDFQIAPGGKVTHGNDFRSEPRLWPVLSRLLRI